jgi:hypothetical protein
MYSVPLRANPNRYGSLCSAVSQRLFHADDFRQEVAAQAMAVRAVR